MDFLSAFFGFFASGATSFTAFTFAMIQNFKRKNTIYYQKKNKKIKDLNLIGEASTSMVDSLQIEWKYTVFPNQRNHVFVTFRRNV